MISPRVACCNYVPCVRATLLFWGGIFVLIWAGKSRKVTRNKGKERRDGKVVPGQAENGDI